MKLIDLEEVFDLHTEAFFDHAIIQLGKSYNKKFIKYFINDEKAVSLVATYQNKIIGYVIGAPNGYQIGLNKKLKFLKYMSVILKPNIWFNRNVLLAIKRTLLSKNIGKPKNQDDKYFSLVGIGVKSEFRRKNIGAELVKNFELEVKTAGWEKLKLSVHENNNNAQRFYEKLGWFHLEKGVGNVIFSRLLA